MSCIGQNQSGHKELEDMGPEHQGDALHSVVKFLFVATVQPVAPSEEFKKAHPHDVMGPVLLAGLHHCPDMV